MLCEWGAFAHDKILQNIEEAREDGRNFKKQHGCTYWKEHFAKGIKLKEYVEARVLNAADTPAEGQPISYRCERSR